MEFSDELIERCAAVFRELPECSYSTAVEAILRESGHAELVAALKPFAGILAKDSPAIERYNDESRVFVPVSINLVGTALAALRKAGSL